MIGLSVCIIPPMVLGLLSWTSSKPANLGVHDGQLSDCGSAPNCVCSQASDAGHRLPPIEFQGDAATALAALSTIVANMPRATIVASTNNYLHAEYKSALFGFVDDVEFLLDAESKQIQFRSASRVGYSDFGVNRARMLDIRTQFQNAVK